MDYLQSITESLSLEMAQGKESLIRAILDRTIPGWTLDDVSGRCAIQIYPDKVEVFLVDGEPTIAMAPTTTKMEDDGDGKVSVVAEFKYRDLTNESRQA